MATWPPTLPTSPLIEGWSETPPNLTLRSGNEVGVPRTRRRARKGVREMTWPMVLTLAQTEVLDVFFINEGGHLSFDGLNHPRTGVAMPRVRIKEMTGYTYLGVDKLYVTVTLEILP